MIQWPDHLLAEAQRDGAEGFEFVIVAYVNGDGCLAIDMSRRCRCEICQQIFQRALSIIQNDEPIGHG